jgi:hypothetical protein
MLHKQVVLEVVGKEQAAQQAQEPLVILHQPVLHKVIVVVTEKVLGM